MLEESSPEEKIASPTIPPQTIPPIKPSIIPTAIPKKVKAEEPTQPESQPIVQPAPQQIKKKAKKETAAKTETKIVGAKPAEKTVVKIPPMTSVPNVLNGLVKDVGGRLVEGAILIVKNEAGIPVRALKTNRLGQFIISTPLPIGQYHIEAEKEGLAFDIIEFETTGQVIPLIEIYAKA
jgi:hypothetical protein